MRDAPRDGLLPLARYSVPAHLLLPLLLWGVGRIDTSAAGYLFLGLHLVFPLALALTLRWWRDHVWELAALLVINHVASFVSAAVLLEIVSG